MVNQCRTHSPLPRSVLRAYLHPSIDPRLCLDCLKCEICLVHHRQSPSLGVVAQSLNALMLCANTEQMVGPLDESRGPSQLHGHGPWLVCEVRGPHTHVT